jgi:TP901 family phage tail tape measure protein
MFGNMTLGITLKAVDLLSGVVKGAADKSLSSMERLKIGITGVSDGMQKMGALSVAGGVAVGAAILKPVQAFMSLEDASTQLKNTLMQDGGVVSKYFTEIDAKASSLGALLPGTTADFYSMASSLKALGVAEESIGKDGGVLEAAAKLGVVLKGQGVDYQQAAVAAAKFKEALGVADNDMVAFIDTIQRTAHLGVGLEEMRYAFSKVAPTLKTMGIQGLQAGNDLAPLVGMLIKTGKSGEEAGTSLGNVINATLNVKKMDGVNKELARYGVSLDFVDKKSGTFKGVLNMVAQLDKLQKLTPVVRANLLTNLFGAGGTADVAAIMATNGAKGYNAMANAMLKQADLNDRVKNSLGTLSSAWDALQGTATSTAALFGESIGPELKAVTTWLAGMTDKVGDWTKANPGLTRGIMLGTLALSGLLVVGGGAVALLGTMGHGVAFVVGGLTKLGPALGFLKSIPTRLIGLNPAMAAITRGAPAMVTGIRGISAAMGVLSGVLLTNPLTYIVLGIAAGGFLIWKYWKPLSGFFRGLFAGIKEGLAPLKPVFQELGKAAAPAFNVIGAAARIVLAPLKAVWGAIKGLLKPVDDVGGGAEKMGVRFGRVIGTMVSLVVGSHIKMFNAGKTMVEMLWKGIQSLAAKPAEAMKGIVQKVRNLLPFSPAKEGPLRDIHRIRLVETIAGSVKPGPLVGAMTQVATAARQAAMPTLSAMPSIAPRRGGQGLPSPSELAGAAGRGAGGGGISLTYSPTVTIGAGAANATQDFEQLLLEHRHTIERMLQGFKDNGTRTSFA